MNDKLTDFIKGYAVYKEKRYAILSEDVGGLTFIGTWVRTDALTEHEDIGEEYE